MTRRSAVILGTWALAVSTASAQFTSSNMTLESHIPLSGFTSNPSSANDCWGYTAPSGREYALIGLRAAVAVVEITDPINPVIVAEISHSNSLWGDIKSYGTYAYAVNETGGGIDVIDLSAVDGGTVTLVQRVTAGGVGNAHNVVVNEDSGYLYVVGGGAAGGRLKVFNLEPDPSNPSFVGSVSSSVGSYVHDAQVVSYTSGTYAGKEIAFCANGSVGLDIYDVTDKSNMTRMSQSDYPNLSYCHQCWISDDHTKLYVNDETDNVNETLVFDITDLASPSLLGTYNSGVTAFDHNVFVHDGKIYEAEYHAGLRVFDIASDPVNPPQIAWFDTYPANDGGGFDGTWGTYPFFASGSIVISDIDSGMFVVSLDLDGGCCVSSVCSVQNEADCATAGGVYFGSGTDCMLDSDGDGTTDCEDLCPSDPAKTIPGDCGCGVAETDGDGDGTPDCLDGCPDDPAKTTPGDCGCGVAETDGDGDGTPDCLDGCPSDPAKTTPGDCGCGVAETDSDGDGTPDCLDGCPSDPAKTAPGDCGCGVADDDADADGVSDCIDNCSLPNPSQADCNGNDIGDACDIADGTSADCNANSIPDECDGGGADTTSPTITCPADRSVDCTASLDPAVNLDLGEATAVDACDPAPVVTYDDTSVSGGCPQDKTVSRTWTAMDASGNVATCVQTITVSDQTAPMFTAPADVTVPYADAGGCDAVVAIVPPAATDDCDAAPIMSYQRSDRANPDEGLADPYPATGYGGPVQITWTALDACGNMSSQIQTITVDPFNELVLDVALGGFVAADLERCLTINLYGCAGGGFASVQHLVQFDGGGAANSVAIDVPCGAYSCVTVRDALHTLRRTLSDTDGFGVAGTQYQADFITAGRSLIGGNLNGDLVVDILDYSVFSSGFGLALPPSDCDTVSPHADINGNGFVDTLDFTFIGINFLAVRDDNCCDLPGATETAGLDAVTVDELWAWGLGHLVPSDLDDDGIVGLRDLALFGAGVRPTYRVGLLRDHVVKGVWHDASLWRDAWVPDATSEVYVDRAHIVVTADALVARLDVETGGTLTIEPGIVMTAEEVIVRRGGVLHVREGGVLAARSIYVEAGGWLVREGIIDLGDDGRFVSETESPMGLNDAR